MSRVRGPRETFVAYEPRQRTWRGDVAKLLDRLGIQAVKRGREWHALCPNPDHDDRSPSWHIKDDPGSDRHGLHHCYPCGLGGGPIGLIMAVRRCTAEEACAWLGDEEAEGAVDNAVEVVGTNRRGGIWHMPPGFSEGPLETWPASARRYAVEKRGITAEQVDRWGLGYAVDGPLGGRIVVPYRRPDGRPVGYTARTYVGDAKRYLEAVGGAGRAAVFGEQHWPPFSREKAARVIIVEGAFNALAVERALPGIPVASLAGSNPGAARLAKIAARFAEAVLLTDPDATGDRVAAEIEDRLGRHLRFVRVRLPQGCDANDLSQRDLRSSIASA